LLASGYTEKPPKIRRAIILSVGGPQVIEAAAQFTYTKKEQNCPDALLKKLEKLCTSRQNVIVQAHRQDLAARGSKTRKRGQKPEGGAHFKNTVLDICSNRWAKSETGGH